MTIIPHSPSSVNPSVGFTLFGVYANSSAPARRAAAATIALDGVPIRYLVALVPSDNVVALL